MRRPGPIEQSGLRLPGRRAATTQQPVRIAAQSAMGRYQFSSKKSLAGGFITRRYRLPAESMNISGPPPGGV